MRVGDECTNLVYPGGGNPRYAYRGTTPEDLDGIDEMISYYPEFSQWKELPAWGFYMRHAKGVTLRNFTFRAQKPDYRPAVVADDVTGLTLDQVVYDEASAPADKQQVVLYKSSYAE